MVQIVEYKIENNILTVGFKVENFVVYSILERYENKTKEELLQLAFQQVKNTIEYEKTLSEHSLVTNKTGDEFIPDVSTVKEIVLMLSDDFIEFAKEEINRSILITTTGLDQYLNELEISPIITSTIGIISENVLIIPKVEDITEVIITASLGDIEISKAIVVTPYTEKVDYVQEAINNVLDRVNRVDGENIELNTRNVELFTQIEDLGKENGALRKQVYNLEDENMLLMMATTEMYEEQYQENLNLMMAITELYELNVGVD